MKRQKFDLSVRKLGLKRKAENLRKNKKQQCNFWNKSETGLHEEQYRFSRVKERRKSIHHHEDIIEPRPQSKDRRNVFSPSCGAATVPRKRKKNGSLQAEVDFEDPPPQDYQQTYATTISSSIAPISSSIAANLRHHHKKKKNSSIGKNPKGKIPDSETLLNSLQAETYWW